LTEKYIKFLKLSKPSAVLPQASVSVQSTFTLWKLARPLSNLTMSANQPPDERFPTPVNKENVESNASNVSNDASGQPVSKINERLGLSIKQKYVKTTI
jgi:hypothetical protein